MNKKRFDWLMAEMGKLKDTGILNSETYDDIETYYSANRSEAVDRTRIFLVFGILGGLLLGGGFILLLAHNWSRFGRLVQVLFFILPLVFVQIAAAVLLFRKGAKRFWYETVGIVYFLLIGAAVAAVSRIYHTGGALETLFLLWSVAGLPVIYFMKSDVAAVLYLVLITGWAAVAQQVGGNAVLYWGLLSAVIPHFILSWKNNNNRIYRGFLEMIITLSVTSSLGVTLEKVVPGFWIPVYCCYFVLLVLCGDIQRNDEKLFQTVRIPGLIGVPAVSVLLTIEDFWEDVGFEYIRDAYRFHRTAAATDYIVLGVFAAAILLLLVRRRVRLTRENMIFMSVLVPAVVCFLLPEYGGLIFHVFILIIGYLLSFPEPFECKSPYSDTGLLMILFSLLIHLPVYDGFSAYWFFLVSCFLTVLFMKSGLFSVEDAVGAERIWRPVCFVLTTGLLYALSFTGYDYPVFPDDSDFSVLLFLAIAVSATAVVFQLVPYMRNNKIQAVMIMIYPVIAMFSLVFRIPGTLFYNFYLLAVGVAVVIYGILRRSMKIANAGIIITIILLITRFFDIDVPFSVKGAAFILTGGLFILFNVYLSKKLKREEEE